MLLARVVQPSTHLPCVNLTVLTVLLISAARPTRHG